MKKLYSVYVKAAKGHPITRAAVFTCKKKALQFINSLKTDLMVYNGREISTAWIEIELGVIQIDA